MMGRAGGAQWAVARGRFGRVKHLSGCTTVTGGTGGEEPHSVNKLDGLAFVCLCLRVFQVAAPGAACSDLLFSFFVPFFWGGGQNLLIHSFFLLPLLTSSNASTPLPLVALPFLSSLFCAPSPPHHHPPTPPHTPLTTARLPACLPSHKRLIG